MKVKTKVKAGPRDCGGPDYIWAHPTTTRRQRRVTAKEHDMKVKTKVKAGPRDCGGGPIVIGVGGDI